LKTFLFHIFCILHSEHIFTITRYQGEHINNLFNGQTFINKTNYNMFIDNTLRMVSEFVKYKK